MTLEQQRKRFSQDLFATEATGVEIVEVGEHYCRCELVLQPRHRNAMGAVMGGVCFTMADFAFAVAANSEALDWVSTESTIHYLSAASSLKLVATTHCIRQGTRCCLYEIEVRNEAGKLLALVTTSGMKIN